MRQINPKLVILAAQTLYTAGTMLEAAAVLQQEGISLAFGGAVFTYIEAVRSRIPGHFLGEDLRTTVTTIEKILHSHQAPSEIKLASASYQTAAAHYRDKRAAIEAYVHQNVSSELLASIYLNNANIDLGNNITSALVLGSMDLITANIEWVNGLLMNYHYRMPAEAMKTYLSTYHEAINLHLDAQRGEPIWAWFERLIDSGAS